AAAGSRHRGSDLTRRPQRHGFRLRAARRPRPPRLPDHRRVAEVPGRGSRPFNGQHRPRRARSV
ncbi:MAG: hypothetical protein AVDCRST_MAG29-2512, partial [uncultured Nocardioidaceae bacterium]